MMSKKYSVSLMCTALLLTLSLFGCAEDPNAQRDIQVRIVTQKVEGLILVDKLDEAATQVREFLASPAAEKFPADQNGELNNLFNFVVNLSVRKKN